MLKPLTPSPVVMSLAGLAVYGYAMWKVIYHDAPLKEVLGYKMGGLLLLSFALADLGQYFSEPDRDPASGWMTSSDWLALTVALILTTIQCFFLRRAFLLWHTPVAATFAVAMIFILVLSCTANHLSLLNGALDRSTPRCHRTVVIGKRSPPPSSTRVGHSIYVRDWLRPRDRIRLDVSRQVHDSVVIGAPVEVLTKSGALGLEWMLHWRFASSIETKIPTPR